jgi:hypothetical protein
VEVLRDRAGAWYARDVYEMEHQGQVKVTRLNSAKFGKLAARWAWYRGDYTLAKVSPKPGQVEVLPGPCARGAFYFDREVMGERMHSGAPTRLDPTKRDLDAETLLVRLPAEFEAKAAHGVLVYVDPTTRGDLHRFMHPVADELGLIIVGAKRTGNEVYAPDRWQLAMDCVASVSERYLVDPRRVYICGISGGGQITTHMWLCFPDVFSGAVPMVALGAYQNIPIGNGTMWAATFGKPKAEYFRVARGQKCAAITGAQDFNQRPVNAAAEVMKRDGLNVRVDDYEDMGHTAPTAERFGDALKWVDEAYRTRREMEKAEAELRLKTVLENTSLKEEERRAALVEVTRVGAWTAAAWRAVAELEPGLAPKGAK